MNTQDFITKTPFSTIYDTELEAYIMEAVNNACEEIVLLTIRGDKRSIALKHYLEELSIDYAELDVYEDISKGALKELITYYEAEELPVVFIMNYDTEDLMYKVVCNKTLNEYKEIIDSLNKRVWGLNSANNLNTNTISNIKDKTEMNTKYNNTLSNDDIMNATEATVYDKEHTTTGDYLNVLLHKSCDEIFIITKNGCGNCKRVKDILDSYSAYYTELNIDDLDDDEKDKVVYELKVKFGVNTMPILGFVDYDSPELSFDLKFNHTVKEFKDVIDDYFEN